MKTVQPLCWLALFFTNNAAAQFTPALIQNDSYWGDGKAEYNIYAAEIVREGAPRPCEVVHILVREQMDMPFLKLNQIINLPAGLLVYQQMHSSYWERRNGALIKFCLTSADSSGNVYKEALRAFEEFTYEYRASSLATEKIAVPQDGHFYDELPFLVRTIDFSKPPNEFEIQLAGTVIHSKKDTLSFQSAKVAWRPNERFIEVTVRHAAGEDHFTLDRQFPHLLREWKAADGNHLKMKRNLKVDYWNYSKPGDRERALNNPMLRLPD